MDSKPHKQTVFDKCDYTIRTDLALESILPLHKGKQGSSGISQRSHIADGYKITHIDVTNKNGADATGKPIGSYITIEAGDFKLPASDFANEVEIVAAEIRSLVANATREVLVIGLGNRAITPDAIGPLAIDSIFATRHIDKSLQERIGLGKLTPVSAVSPGVLGQTGVETAEIVKALVGTLKPSCVIVIDALAARSVSRLASTVQLTNSGIVPGSGVQNSRAALNKEALGIPVISIGVPMVVDLGTAAYELLGIDEDNAQACTKQELRGMMVTPREVDTAVEHSARLVAFAINRALQPQLSLEDITALVG